MRKAMKKDLNSIKKNIGLDFIIWLFSILMKFTHMNHFLL